MGTLRCALGALSLVLALAAPAAARQQPEVSAYLSSGVVKLGATVQLTVAVEGAQDARILALPEVDGLDIEPPGRPSPSVFTQQIGARITTSRTLRWAMAIRPRRTGDFTIPPLRLSVDGREVLAPRKEIALKVVTDLRGEELGFIEVLDPPRRVYEGEPFTLDLRFGWDASLQVRSLQLFLPWWEALPGAIELDEGPRNPASVWHEVALNRRVRIAVEELPYDERGGREMRTFRLRRRMLASRSGTLDVTDSTLEFVRLVARSQSLLGSDKVEEFYVHMPGFGIEVLPVPEEGRPFEWTGAVGTLVASRRVDRRDVDVGDSVKLTVSWMGDGNLEFFDPPDLSRLDAFAGFRVLGAEDVNRDGERRVTYDLVPVSPEVTEIPPVPLSIFDTSAEEYRTIETEAVPIRVRPLEGASGLDGGEEPGVVLDIVDIRSEPAARRVPPRPGPGWVIGGLAGVPALWLVARRVARRRHDPDSPLERRRRKALRGLRRELGRARTASEQSHALHRFLAARTGEPDQAWVGRAPRRWAEAHEHALEPAAAEGLEVLIGELDRRAYAGRDEPVERAHVLSVAADAVRGGL